MTQEALEKLGQGCALDALEALFVAKATALEAVQSSLGALSRPPLDQAALLAQALQAQARSARLEAQLAEVLGEQRRSLKNVNEVTKAYGKSFVDKLGIKGLDLES